MEATIGVVKYAKYGIASNGLNIPIIRENVTIWPGETQGDFSIAAACNFENCPKKWTHRQFNHQTHPKYSTSNIKDHLEKIHKVRFPGAATPQTIIPTAPVKHPLEYSELEFLALPLDVDMDMHKLGRKRHKSGEDTDGSDLLHSSSSSGSSSSRSSSPLQARPISPTQSTVLHFLLLDHPLSPAEVATRISWYRERYGENDRTSGSQLVLLHLLSFFCSDFVSQADSVGFIVWASSYLKNFAVHWTDATVLMTQLFYQFDNISSSLSPGRSSRRQDGRFNAVTFPEYVRDKHFMGGSVVLVGQDWPLGLVDFFTGFGLQIEAEYQNSVMIAPALQATQYRNPPNTEDEDGTDDCGNNGEPSNFGACGDKNGGDTGGDDSPTDLLDSLFGIGSTWDQSTLAESVAEAFASLSIVSGISRRALGSDGKTVRGSDGDKDDDQASERLEIGKTFRDNPVLPQNHAKVEDATCVEQERELNGLSSKKEISDDNGPPIMALRKTKPDTIHFDSPLNDSEDESSRLLSRQSPKLPEYPTPPLDRPSGSGKSTIAKTWTSSVIGHSYIPNICAEDQKFLSRYIIQEALGEGGFAFVTAATRKSDGRRVAIKFIFKNKMLAESWARDKELGVIPIEVLILKNVHHPNIIEYVDYHLGIDFIYMVTEFFGSPWPAPQPNLDSLANEEMSLNNLTQCTLFDCIEQHSRLTENQARHIFRQVVDGTAHLLRFGILHRDLKDENILIDDTFKIKLIDFGSGAFVRKGQLFDRFYATIPYASPEILLGTKYAGPEAQMWSLGCLLFVMLHGVAPFDSPQKAIAGETQPIDTGLSKICIDLLQWMLEPRVARRATIEQVRSHPWIAGDVNSQNQVYAKKTAIWAYPQGPPPNPNNGPVPALNGGSSIDNSCIMDLRTRGSPSPYYFCAGDWITITVLERQTWNPLRLTVASGVQCQNYVDTKNGACYLGVYASGSGDLKDSMKFQVFPAAYNWFAGEWTFLLRDYQGRWVTTSTEGPLQYHDKHHRDVLLVNVYQPANANNASAEQFILKNTQRATKDSWFIRKRDTCYFQNHDYSLGEDNDMKHGRQPSFICGWDEYHNNVNYVKSEANNGVWFSPVPAPASVSSPYQMNMTSSGFDLSAGVSTDSGPPTLSSVTIVNFGGGTPRTSVTMSSTAENTVQSSRGFEWGAGISVGASVGFGGQQIGGFGVGLTVGLDYSNTDTNTVHTANSTSQSTELWIYTENNSAQKALTNVKQKSIVNVPYWYTITRTWKDGTVMNLNLTGTFNVNWYTSAHACTGAPVDMSLALLKQLPINQPVCVSSNPNP
ncbi:hypothetical protein SmJEL517_g03722 [Synchytrium microbalum]|uniref:Protein kinase domain-containing protein n=1 Tax=Synchytrium microbalum TaxID=1806994 RepID=A0A507C1Q8_9FUNG|nr:uncharacterized protein SmJEL517_g03722 [Synchytrium microbalum]TPX33361.1 hypothetical protein SmJEL517_g03722 [Synchytrium microbalum]